MNPAALCVSTTPQSRSLNWRFSFSRYRRRQAQAFPGGLDLRRAHGFPRRHDNKKQEASSRLCVAGLDVYALCVERLLEHRFLDGNGDGDGRADHRVILAAPVGYVNAWFALFSVFFDLVFEGTLEGILVSRGCAAGSIE